MNRARRMYRVARRRAAWAARDMSNRFTGRRTVHFLHIGKTGGSAIATALNASPPSAVDLRLRGHHVPLDAVPAGHLAMFFLRDPVARFVSGFESRRRQGRPRYDKPWSPGERVAFERFSTADALASALYDEPAAASAMAAIGHVNTPFTFWVRSASTLEARAHSLFFIGFQESLEEDFVALCSKLGCRARLPADPIVAHRSPEPPPALSDLAIEKLRRWYAEDLEIYDTARSIAESVNG